MYINDSYTHTHTHTHAHLCPSKAGLSSYPKSAMIHILGIPRDKPNLFPPKGTIPSGPLRRPPHPALPISIITHHQTDLSYLREPPFFVPWPAPGLKTSVYKAVIRPQTDILSNNLISLNSTQKSNLYILC